MKINKNKFFKKEFNSEIKEIHLRYKLHSRKKKFIYSTLKLNIIKINENDLLKSFFQIHSSTTKQLK